jgi:ParB family chromosome partitioning protein
MTNRGLGRGLSDLLGERKEERAANKEEVAEISVESIKVGVYQPRKDFDRESLYELSESIKKNGLIQPIIVSKTTSGYVIIAGERRWRACQIIGMKNIQAIVKNLDDKSMLKCALVENVQREDLNVVEEAEGYLRLMGEFGYTQEELSSIIGKSRSHVANILRLNTLPEPIKQHLIKKRLSMGHARTLIGHESAEDIANVIMDKGLNVRQTEQFVKSWNKPFEEVREREKPNDDISALVEVLSNKFGMKVTIDQIGSGGKIIFHYYTIEQLDEILTKLGK